MRLISKTGIGAAIVAAALFMMPAPAAAVIILNPGNADCSAPGPPAGPSHDDDFLTDYCGVDASTVDLFYKNDGNEEGSFEGDYNSTFDDSSATITWDGPGIIDCGECWLVAKDGNANPGWYGWNLGPTGFDWDGVETIQVSGLFIGTGALSHISIWGAENGGGDGPPEGPGPEPASLLLLGMGLVAVGARMRRARS